MSGFLCEPFEEGGFGFVCGGCFWRVMVVPFDYPHSKKRTQMLEKKILRVSEMMFLSQSTK